MTPNILLLLALVTAILAQNESVENVQGKETLRLCWNDFEDLRNQTGDALVMTIPGNLTNGIPNEHVDFRLEKNENELPCESSFVTTVKWEDGIIPERLDPGKSRIKGERLRHSGKNTVHFTHEGHFHLDGHYYNTKQFCIKSLSNTDIKLRVCNVTCTSASSNICIPKCCGPDEILVYWNFTCRKITSLESKWKAKIHQPEYPHNEVTGEEEKIHIVRKRLDCHFFEQWPLSKTMRANNRTVFDNEIAWKMLPNGRPVFHAKNNSQWTPLPPGDFCMDGFANWGFGGNGTYSGDHEMHTVLLLCPSDNDDDNNGASNEIVKNVPGKDKLGLCWNDFEDLRNQTSDDLVMTIPGNLTNGIPNEHVDFILEANDNGLSCESNFVTTVKWEDGIIPGRLHPNKTKIQGERLRHSGKNTVHFTHEGHFHLDGHYYNTKQFCIKSLSDTDIKLRVCNVSCTSASTSICIPKCCGPDEILVYWNFTCRKITSQESKWKAKIHQPLYPHNELTAEDEKIHIVRKRLDCQFFERWPLSKTVRARNKSVFDYDVAWKMLPNGRPVFRARNRQWTPLPPGDFCMDGFANWGFGGDGTYSGDHEMHTVLILCPSDDTGASNNALFDEGKAWAYFVTLLLSSLFLVLTILVHLLLWDKQHLHGLTVLSHSASMFCFYILCAIAQLLTIFPTLNGKTGLDPTERGWFCMGIAISSHYFFMATFAWLTIMNFDLWLTFRSMRPVSKMSKRIRRFRLYSLLGWGIPLALISIFIYINEKYRDPMYEVVIPEYAQNNCFVSIWSRGYYMYSLLAIALSINTILILSTFYIFYEFRKQNANTFTTRRAKSDKYSVRLFIKLFCVMGVAWFTELLSWYYNGDEKPKIVIFLDCLTYFQTAAIFYIFCINRRTLKQLEDKYPVLCGFIGPLRRLHWFKYSDAEGVEMTTPGGSTTPRKMSLSATNNSRLDSTLPRKASSSSILSGNSAKYVVNGKLERMESINLDSDATEDKKGEGGKPTADNVHHAPDLIRNT